MTEKQKKTGNKSLFFLAVVFSCWGKAVFAQKPVVTLSVSDKNVNIDQVITVTVTYNISGSVKVDYPSEFSVDYGAMNGMEQTMDASTGKICSSYYTQQNGTFSKKGTYTFRAYVHHGGKEYASNKVTITVTEETEEEEPLVVNTKDPIFGIIQAPKTTVYEGEAILLKAKMFSFYDITGLEAYNPFKPDKTAEQYVFENQRTSLEQTKYNGKNALTLEYGKQLLFPVATGKCRIQPFEMAVEYQAGNSFFGRTYTFKSAPLFLNVKPLPAGAPKSFIGGVGRFDLRQELGKTDLKQGDVFTLKLLVHGTGNLHNINAPIVDLPKGCVIYGDPERKDEHAYTEEGVEGTVTFLYNIQLNNAGTIHFHPQEISFFDPKTEKYLRAETKGFSLNVVGNAALATLNSPPQHPVAKTESVSSPHKKTQKNGRSSSSVGLYLGIGAPLLLTGFLLFFFVGKRRKNPSFDASREENKPVSPSILTELPKETEDYWKVALQNLDNPRSFATLFPKAIIQRIENKYAQPALTRERAFVYMQENHPENAEQVRDIIETCDRYNYGFETGELDTKELFRRAKSLI